MAVDEVVFTAKKDHNGEETRGSSLLRNKTTMAGGTRGASLLRNQTTMDVKGEWFFTVKKPDHNGGGRGGLHC